MTLHLLEPELEDLLQTIAADPRATLLKVDRPALTRGLFDRSPLVRESCTLLTSAERHLLKVHRVKLGQLLRSACFDLLLGKNEEAKFYSTNWGAGFFPDWGGLRESRELALMFARAELCDPLRSAVLKAVASHDPLDYAILLCRVHPSAIGYLYLSDAYQLSDNREFEKKAIRIAGTLATTKKEKAHVLSYQAFEYVMDLKYLDGIHDHRAVFQTGNVWPNEALSWLCLSVQATNEKLFLGGVEAVDEAQITARTLKEWVDDQVDLRKCGFWSPTRDSFLFSRKHRENANAQVRYVLDTLFRK